MQDFQKVLLLKYGEIALKGLNRAVFENQLEKNARAALKKHGEFTFTREQSTMTVSCEDENFDIETIVPDVCRIFGIATVHPAFKTGKDIGQIKQVARNCIVPLVAGKSSFAVTAKRSDKRFPLTSPELASQIGFALGELNPDCKVDLHSPEILITVEIRSDGAYIHGAKYRGAGGLPHGSSGNGLLLLSGGIDSPVAGYMMARRGMRISALHFSSEPYTSERSLQKVIALAGLLEEYCGKINFINISLTDIQHQIRDKCNNDYLTLILRRFMMRIADRVATNNGMDCLITGESLGQVASQTINALRVTSDAANIQIFRPLIGFDKYQIIEIAKDISTYNKSIEPYDDCCTVFVPRHPITKPKLHAVLDEESKLDTPSLVQNALDNIRYF